jgi:hypothetical protein
MPAPRYCRRPKKSGATRTLHRIGANIKALFPGRDVLGHDCDVRHNAEALGQSSVAPMLQVFWGFLVMRRDFALLLRRFDAVAGRMNRGLALVALALAILCSATVSLRLAETGSLLSP